MTQLSTYETRTSLMLISSLIWWAVMEQIRLSFRRAVLKAVAMISYGLTVTAAIGVSVTEKEMSHGD